MASSVKNKIIEFVNYKKISRRQFLLSCGFSESYLNNISKGISNEAIDKIKAAYPELSMAWLVLDEGKMLKSEMDSSNEDYSVSDNSGGTNQGGSNNVNIASPSHGTQKIIHPDKSMEIEMTSQQEDVSSLKNENELLKSRISELEDIIARQNRVIDKLTL